ncbi:hypothetical protein AB0K16_53655 [Nonomuraea jabiensis]|uniref:hypothetical protein n=1 Tax=Nonomuraea jabiensis TaxID=882448 RepID=UPI00343DD5C7
MVDLPSGPLAEVDLEFQKMALETGGLTFDLAGTTVREKLLQATAHDICRGHLGLAFTMHITALNMHGVPYADMLALIRFVAPYAGYPAAADALGRVAQVAAELGLDTTPEPSRVAEGSPGVAWPVSDPWMAEFLASRTGRAWSEERLSARERAFVALTAHITRSSFGESFHRHVALALRVAGPGDVRDAVRFTAELGVTDAAAALEALEQVLAAA